MASFNPSLIMQPWMMYNSNSHLASLALCPYQLHQSWVIGIHTSILHTSHLHITHLHKPYLHNSHLHITHLHNPYLHYTHFHNLHITMHMCHTNEMVPSLIRYSRSLLNNNRKSSLLDVSDPSESQSNLLDQIFKFIGSKPEQAVRGNHTHSVSMALFSFR